MMVLALALEAGGFNSARSFMAGRNLPLLASDVNEWAAFLTLREEDREERMREARVKARADQITRNPSRGR